MHPHEDQIQLQTLPVQTILGVRITMAVKIIFFAVALFCLPLFLSGPQLLVGSIVNLMLIWATRSLSWKRAWPLAFLPSIAAVLHGAIFGPFTIFLVYMMPAIRIGNLALMYVVKKNSSKWLGVIAWSAVKAVFLFGIAFALFQLNILPNIFLKAMGTMQLATAMIWGVALCTLISVRKLYRQRWF